MIPKFRAWVKPEKKMYPVSAIDFDDNERLCSVTPLYEEEVRKNPHFWPDPFIAEQVVLMQSTGVKDCNGKEIYEGDIVFWQWGEIGDNIYTNCGKEIVDSDLHTLVMLEEADRLLVLGNIYESPELVKNKNIK